MTELTSSSFQNPDRQDAGRRGGHPLFQRPDEVVNDLGLSRAQKRALLASWASDARAVADAPSMRQLEDGSVVEVDEILRALKALDARDNHSHSDSRRAGAPWLERRRRLALRKWPRIVSRRRRDDDDDPPPCPAFAAIPPRTGGGGAFAYPEPALA